MVGLRVHVRGRPVLTAALPQEDYLVVASACWDRGRPGGRAEWLFHSTGIDDRLDNLRWLWVRNPPRRLWMDITVIDVPAADAPRRAPRRKMDWQASLERRKASDLKRAEELKARLRQIRSGIRYKEPIWTARPPAVAFRVTLNGDELGRVGVADPGSLSVDVAVRRRPQRVSAVLHVHGGDRVGPKTWRWREWPWSGRRLRVGDRVRIEVMAPVRLSPSRLRDEESTEPTDVPEINRKLNELRKRLRSAYYRSEAAAMIQFERERLPARCYSRRETRRSVTAKTEVEAVTDVLNAWRRAVKSG